MSKTTKIVLVGFAFSLFCFLVLLTFSASRPAHISESPAVTAVRPDDRPSPMAAPEMEKSTRKENAGTSDAPKGVVPGPIPTQASSPEVRTPVPRYDEEVRKRVREQIAQDRKRADMDKLVTGYVPSKVGDVIDQILAEMDFGNIAFNSPDKMKLNSPSNIQLVVSPTETIEKLKESIVAEGQKHGEQIRISDTMEARLTGTAFQIGAITPEVQGITGKEVTNWKWEVRPTQYGRHKLHLTLSALVTLKGSSVPRSIRTFERTIEVEVSSWQKTFLLFRENWEWMWTLVTFPIIGWWLRRKHLKDNGTTPLTDQTKSVSLSTEVAVQQAVMGESEPSPPTESATAPVPSPASERGSTTQEQDTETGS